MADRDPRPAPPPRRRSVMTRGGSAGSGAGQGSGARPDARSTVQLLDPLTAYPRPPFPKQAQRLPGGDDHLDPKPDHGEESYVGSGRLAGLATIVTGADSGIGKAIALAFAREGADVVASYLEETEDARGTVDLVAAEGRRVVAVAGDLQDEAHCRRLIEQARDELGRIDVLVSNAAVQVRRERIEDIPTDEWEMTLRTNLSATFWLCREAVPHIPRGGSIIITSSIQATHPSPNLLAYATTKGGLYTFAKALSGSMIERGVRVNVVAPGPVWTPLVAATSGPEKNSTFGSDVPTGRPAQPAELAGAYVFLASPESSYITGAAIPVTGGEYFS